MWSWRPSSPKSTVLSLDTPGSSGVGSSLKVGRLETQSWSFSSSPKVRKKLMSQSIGSQARGFVPHLWKVHPFVFYLALQLIGWGLPTLGRAVCFIQFISAKVNLIQKHPCRYTQNYIWLGVRASHGPDKSTHKINHHNKTLL